MLGIVSSLFRYFFPKKATKSPTSRPSHSRSPAVSERQTTSFLFQEDIEPLWIARGRPYPFPIPPVVYFSENPPVLPSDVRLKVGKALEGRFQASPASIKIISVLNDPHSSAAQITEAATKDPNLASRLLKIVNSAAFGLSKEITVVGRAIGILGLNTVRSLAMAEAVQVSGPDAPSVAQQRALWIHAALTSACAYAWSRNMTGVDSGEAATAGLLVNIGKMLLRPQEVQKLCEETKLPPSLIEGYGGSCFAETWGLPSKIGRVLEYAHTPFFYPLKSIPEDIRLLVLVVGFASFVSRWYGFNNGDPPEALPGAEFLSAIGWVPKPNGRWIPGDVILEMEKARISIENFLR